MDVFVDRRDLQYCSMDTDSADTQDAVVKPNISPENTFGSPVPTGLFKEEYSGDGIIALCRKM